MRAYRPRARSRPGRGSRRPPPPPSRPRAPGRTPRAPAGRGGGGAWKARSSPARPPMPQLLGRLHESQVLRGHLIGQHVADPGAAARHAADVPAAQIHPDAVAARLRQALSLGAIRCAISAYGPAVARISKKPSRCLPARRASLCTTRNRRRDLSVKPVGWPSRSALAAASAASAGDAAGGSAASKKVAQRLDTSNDQTADASRVILDDAGRASQRPARTRPTTCVTAVLSRRVTAPAPR